MFKDGKRKGLVNSLDQRVNDHRSIQNHTQLLPHFHLQRQSC